MYLDNSVEKFTINGITVTMARRPSIKGTYNGDGLITWSSGVIWVKQRKRNNIIDKLFCDLAIIKLNIVLPPISCNIIIFLYTR